MNEKPFKLPMDFGEALARIARTPRKAVDAIKDAKAAKPPRRIRPKGRST